MARRHPILSFVAIVLVIVGLVHFSRSFDTSSTLARVQKYAPGGDAAAPAAREKPSQAGHEEPASAPASDEHAQPAAPGSRAGGSLDADASAALLPLDELAAGKPIMAKMPNQTIRAEVGNAGWKLLHTILSQYPEEPTDEDRQTLSTYLKFFSRVYPCRECAEHFQELLRQHPPQLASRKTAVMWGCDAHNKVNKRLGKEIFDCAYIFDKYDCGCGSPDAEQDASQSAAGHDAAGHAGPDKAGVKVTEPAPLVAGG